MKKLLLMAFALALAFVSRAGGENYALWLYWTVDSTASGIEFCGANLYVVENGQGNLVSTKWANSATPVTTLSGANELGQGDQDCTLCLMSDISGIGIGAAFYVELVNGLGEVVGWWKGDYMSMETLTTVHKALDGIVSGLQTKEPFQHVHGGQWVADQFSSVPEPSGGLLTLVGLALLALRRRKTS